MLPLKLWYPVFFPVFYFRVVILVMMVTYGDEKARGMLIEEIFHRIVCFSLGGKKTHVEGE